MIYRTLAEDIFLYEDAVAELRKSELLTALTAVSVSASVLEGQYSKSSQKQIGKLNLVVLLNMIRAHPENSGWMIQWATSIREHTSAWTQSVLYIIVAIYSSSHL
jgi:exportin-5